MGTSRIGALAVDSHRYFEVGAEVALFCGVEQERLTFEDQAGVGDGGDDQGGECVGGVGGGGMGSGGPPLW